MPRLRLGLRARTAIAYALLSLIGAIVLSSLTFVIVRHVLLVQREDLAVRQAIANATVVRSVLVGPSADIPQLLVSLDGSTPARPLIQLGDEWYAATVDLGSNDVPASLIAVVDEHLAGRQRIHRPSGPFIVTGVSIPAVGGRYFELAPMSDLESTLNTVAVALAGAAAVTLVGGALAGWWASSRVVRPLGHVASAAHSISQGELGTRLPTDDPDLTPLTTAFNEMASSLEARIERESRFTSDVSHELRNPLTAIIAAVGLAERGEQSERQKMAMQIVRDRVDHLRALVLDLLEISRCDAGAAELSLQPVEVRALVESTVAEQQLEPKFVYRRVSPETRQLLDGRRVERAVVNLLANAVNYGGGPTVVEVALDDAHLTIAIEDCGPGVNPEERSAIFGRFHRGREANSVDSPSGTGLGLALVEEHIRLHGGTVTVENSACGGARFVITLPRRDP